MGIGDSFSTLKPPDSDPPFSLDPCSTHLNAKCSKHFTRAEDGFAQSWKGEVVFMNPPYGTDITRWVAKAHASAGEGATVVCLVPARTDTAWWHQYAMKHEIRFLRDASNSVRARIRRL